MQIAGLTGLGTEPPVAALRDSARTKHDRVLLACVGLLGFLVVLAFTADVFAAFLHVPLDPREGWNAYHALHAFEGGLNPRLPSMMYNNYPPLSFLVAGGLGKLVGDNIVAGRIIALVSTAGTALFIGTIGRSMGCRNLEAAISALLFLACPRLLSEFARIDDPQMLGQAISCAGFAFTLRKTARGRAIRSGALLLALACFVKPIFVVQPLALLIWLTRYEPRNAIRFSFYGLLYVGLGVAAADLVFGTTLVEHIVSPRIYQFSKMLSHPGAWLLTGLFPLAATLYLFGFREDRYARLCAIYAVVAVISGLGLSGGQGVGGNATFDMSIAASLGTGVFINRIRGGATPPKWLGSTAGTSIVLISTAAAAIDLPAQMSDTFVSFQHGALSIAEPVSKRAQIVRMDIEFLRANQGTALCETLALCYWAGKSPEVDAFNLTQAFKSHARSEADLVDLLDARHYNIVELDRYSHFGYSALLRCAFARNYQVHHADEFGIFLRPRANGTALAESTLSRCSADLDRYLFGNIN